jgi:hypothetical protein
MELYHNTKAADKNISPQIIGTACHHINQEQINDLLQTVKEGFLAFSVTVGLNFKTMLKRKNFNSIVFLQLKQMLIT